MFSPSRVLQLSLVLVGLVIPVTMSAAGLNFYSIGKGCYFHQDAGSAPVLRPYKPWFFEARLVFTNATGAFITANLGLPGSIFATTPIFPPDYDNLTRENDQASLDAAFTNGFYKFSFFINAQPSVTVSNLLVTGAFPSAPNITNLTDAQAIDPSSDFTIAWNPFPGGTTNDLVIISLQTSTGAVFQTSNIVGATNALNGTSASVLIPAGMLPPGRAYFGRLIFVTVQSTVTNQSTGAKGATLYSSQTDFYVKTIGGSDSTPPSLLASVPVNGATGVPTNTPLVLTFSEPMKTNFFSLLWTGSGSSLAVWNADDTEFARAPVLFFSPNRTQTVVLNPLPQVSFTDQSGNFLPPDIVITFMTSTNSYQPAMPILGQPQRISSSLCQVDLTGETNRGYALQFSTNLTSWISFATNTAFDGGIHFADTNAVTAARFYRAIAY